MSPEKEQALFLRWPDWFRSVADVQKSLMRFGFCCGDGWFPIIWQLFEAIEPHVAALDQEGPPFEIIQVKEKFGGFRCYVNRHSDEISAAVESATQACSRTCEKCGKPGTQKARGGWRTLCPFCPLDHPLQLTMDDAEFAEFSQRLPRTDDIEVYCRAFPWVMDFERIDDGFRVSVLAADLGRVASLVDGWKKEHDRGDVQIDWVAIRPEA
jgi:hypothetical protein